MSLDDLLAIAVYVLVPFGWVSAFILAYAARKPPRIGALTERSVIASIIALFLTSIAVLVYNSESGRTLIAQEVASVMFRITVLLLGIVPVSWVVLWLTDRLGDGVTRDVQLNRIEASIADNTRISQEASDHADAAYHEANSVNVKIAKQGEALVAQGKAQAADRADRKAGGA